MITYEQFLRNSAVERRVIDTFLDRSSHAWARFDPELGYVLGDSLPHNGTDGCWTISTTDGNGARSSRMYAQRTCRINTYGNSFTECHQVSDGETWQEYLAAHLGEPIRNFGVGGYGVYQSYRRMLRTERSSLAAQYVLLYIWGDDHFRSAQRCRHAHIYTSWDHLGGRAFHNNFWAHIEMDPGSGAFVEKENLLPTEKGLYRMCDPDFMLETLRDDLMLQLCVLDQVDPASIDRKPLNALAERLGTAGFHGDSSTSAASAALRIMRAYGFAATRWSIDKAARFSQGAGKQLLVLLQCPDATRQVLLGEARYDQEIVEYLSREGVPFFDMNVAHGEDYRSFNLSVDDYLNRYFIGHYNAQGNHLFAYALKDTLVGLLDPRPLTYRNDSTRALDFDRFLSR
jgi:hypothetical protein